MHKYKISLSTLIKYLIYLYIFILVTSVSTGTMPVKVIRVVLTAALVFYILRSKAFKFNFYITWAVVFLLYNVVMTQFASYKNYAVEYTATLLYILIINIGVCFFMMKHDAMVGMIKAFIFSTIVEAATTFGRNGLMVFLTARRTDEGSANTLGFYAAMAFILSLILFRKFKGKNQRYIYGIACFLCAMIALLSASRKAIIYAVVPLVVYWIFSSKNPIKSFRNTIIALATVVIGYYALMHIPFIYNLLGQRVQSMVAGFLGGATDASTSTRLRLIEAGMLWFRQEPWFGYGLANYSAMNWAIRGSIYYAHNNYVELLVDCGIMGTIIYYWLYINIILIAVKNKLMDRKVKGFIIGIVLSYIIGDYGMVSYNFAIFQLILMCLYVFALGRSTICEVESRPIQGTQMKMGDK